MKEINYLVFRCYTRQPIYTFSKSITVIMTLLNSIVRSRYSEKYLLRQNLSAGSAQKNITDKELDAFLKKVENSKVKDFEVKLRLKDKNVNEVFPLSFSITYDDYKRYLLEAFGPGKAGRKILSPAGVLKVEVCIQSSLVSEEVLPEFELAFKDLYVSSNSSYGYWDMMCMKDALFSKRSIYEKGLLLHRSVANQYDNYTAGIFEGNMLNRKHVKLLEEQAAVIMEDCLCELLGDGSSYLKPKKELPRDMKNSPVVERILPLERADYHEKINGAYILNSSHIEKLGGIDVIKSCLPDNTSLLQYSNGAILIHDCHHSGDIDELVAFLECLIPFKMHASFAFSKDFADSLRFVCTKEDKYNVCLCINLNNSTSVISFNLIDSNSKPEFADFEKIVCDWIESQGEKSQVCYDGNTNVLNWKLDASGINDLKIIELYDLLNQYAVENNIFAFLNIGEFKEEGLPVMRKMGLDNLYVTF